MPKNKKYKSEGAGAEEHLLDLLERNVAGNLNGYICYTCWRVFVAVSKRVVKIDHDLWIEGDKREE